MKNLLFPFSLLVSFARQGVNASRHLKDGVVDDLEGDSFHLPNDVDDHHHINPTNFSGFPLNPGRTPFVGQDTDDTCGLTCRGPDEYAFGLLSCLREAFQDQNGVMPSVTIAKSRIGDTKLSKVVFSPATSLEPGAFVLNEYNVARKALVNSRLPSAILFAETIEDVQHGVNCARVNGYKISPRGRGHDPAGLSSLDGSLVIDMQLNCKLDDFVADKTVKGDHIVPGSKYIGTMKAPSGCTNAVFLGAVYDEFKEESGFNVCGSCPAVGITGYILNGGYGATTPYAGTSADLVTEIEMVLYNGKRITASKTENEDIFWASQGGTGGIGVITSFVSRIIENPSQTKKFTGFAINFAPFTDTTNKTQVDTQTEILMRMQHLTYDNPRGVLFGGSSSISGSTDTNPSSCRTINGQFLGSIEEFLDVFFDAGLLDPELLVTGEDQPNAPSFGIRNYELLCSDNNAVDYACLKKEFGDQFPEYGLTVAEYNTQGEMQAQEICSVWGTNPGGFSVMERTLDICADLGVSNEFCYRITDPETGITFINVSPQSCFGREVIAAFLSNGKVPQGFLNRKGITDSVYDMLGPNGLALGQQNLGNPGMGAGGLIIPPLQRETFRKLLAIQADGNPNITTGVMFTTGTQININHFVHGAPLLVPPESSGYPHRNAAWNLQLQGQLPRFNSILLEDRAYQGDAINLQVYGNYGPSVRMPNYERHVYVDKVEELSRIRTLHDPLGGFDSPRYVDRNRRAPRTVPLFPEKNPKTSIQEK